ncbi:MAG TPA: hypothetical protein DGB72_05870 [Gemmatimonadetes bacterium]|nr:hypothetical protein [Gemmatimonadota bacterium]
MSADDKECKQCGWDLSKNAPPSTDPGDNKARLGVAAGLIVAYGVMSFLIQGTPAEARAEPARATQYAAAPEPRTEPVSEPAMAIGTLPQSVSSAPAASTASSALITIKVADTKGASIQSRDALQYKFEVPETDQKCRLVGSTRGIGGFGRNIEVFLLTDDDYVFWHANPAAIAPSQWETFRGSETTLDYALPGPGTYHFVVSNQMSPTPQTVAVKAQVKCVR